MSMRRRKRERAGGREEGSDSQLVRGKEWWKEGRNVFIYDVNEIKCTRNCYTGVCKVLLMLFIPVSPRGMSNIPFPRHLRPLTHGQLKYIWVSLYAPVLTKQPWKKHFICKFLLHLYFNKHRHNHHPHRRHQFLSCDWMVTTTLPQPALANILGSHMIKIT